MANGENDRPSARISPGLIQSEFFAVIVDGETRQIPTTALRLVPWLIAGATLCSFPAAARADDTPLAPIVLRVLPYIANRFPAGKKTFTVAIAYRPGNPGRACVRAVQAAVGEATIAGARVQIVGAAFEETSAFEATVVAAAAVVIFVCPGLDEAVGKISTVSRRHAMLTLCTSEGYVRAGLSIGLTFHDGRRRILVNLAATRAEGARLDLDLLRMAMVLQ